MNEHTHDKRLKRTAKDSLFSIDIGTTIQQYLHPLFVPYVLQHEVSGQTAMSRDLPTISRPLLWGVNCPTRGQFFSSTAGPLEAPFPAPHPQRPRDVQTKAFYTAFNKMIELNTVTRQHRADNISVRFRKLR